MLQRTSGKSGVDRLTDKERECLKRWLDHRTAKEIALELGISHHAVEKRLKSARAKLGVSSTIEAARLLGETEGYGRAASQSPEVVEERCLPQPPVVDGTAVPATIRRRHIWIAGVTAMLLTLLAASGLFALGDASPVRDTSLFVMDARALDLDSNGDGFLDRREFDEGTVTVAVTRQERGRSVAERKARVTFEELDSNRDARVSSAEYASGMKRLEQRLEAELAAVTSGG